MFAWKCVFGSRDQGDFRNVRGTFLSIFWGRFFAIWLAFVEGNHWRFSFVLCLCFVRLI